MPNALGTLFNIILKFCAAFKRMRYFITQYVIFQKVIAILDKLKDERENSGRKDEEEEPKSSELSELDEDWNKDDRDGDGDEDGGIIYVN